MSVARILAMACVVALVVPASGYAQTAGFKCPADGTVVQYSDGGVSTWLSAGADHCRIENKAANGSVFNGLWYAPGGSRANNASTAWIDQLQPAKLWPLAVGKRIEAKYSGASPGDGSQGVWAYTAAVDGYAKLTTKAGTFDVFTLTWQEQALTHSYKRTTRYWYAPNPGVVVRMESSDNRGGSRNAEAVAIKR